MEAAGAIGLFGLAGTAEIGGGYLVWRWLREGAGLALGLAGMIGALVVSVGVGIIFTPRPSG
jgi:small multidrug resistance family-3 protein